MKRKEKEKITTKRKYVTYAFPDFLPVPEHDQSSMI